MIDMNKKKWQVMTLIGLLPAIVGIGLILISVTPMDMIIGIFVAICGILIMWVTRYVYKHPNVKSSEVK